MDHRLRSLLLGAALLLTACAPQLPTPTQPSGIDLVREDRHRDEAVVEGIATSHDPGMLSSEDGWGFRLRTVIDVPAHQVSHQLYFYVDYSEADGQDRVYKQALDEAGNPLPLRQLRSVQIGCGDYGCHYREDMAVDLDNGVLRAHAGSGLKIRIIPGGGLPYTITVSPSQIGIQYLALTNYFQLHHFALPEDLTVPAKAGGVRIDRLGIEVLPADDVDVAFAGLPNKQGVRMYRIAANAPATRNGLLADDIVTAYDGKPVATPADLAAAVRAGPAHGAVQLTLWHVGAAGRNPEQATLDLDGAAAGLIPPARAPLTPAGLMAVDPVPQKYAAMQGVVEGLFADHSYSYRSRPRVVRERTIIIENPAPSDIP